MPGIYTEYMELFGNICEGRTVEITAPKDTKLVAFQYLSQFKATQHVPPYIRVFVETKGR